MLLLPCFGSLSAQEKRTEINVDFRVGSRVLEPSLGSNATRLSEIITLLKDVENAIRSNSQESPFAVRLLPKELLR